MSNVFFFWLSTFCKPFMWIFIDFTSLSRNRSSFHILCVPWCWIFGWLIFRTKNQNLQFFSEVEWNVDRASHNESSLYDVTAISHHLQVVLTNRNKIRWYFIVAKTNLIIWIIFLHTLTHSAQFTHKLSFVYSIRIRMASTVFFLGFFVRPQIECECLKYRMLDGAVNWIYSVRFPLNYPHRMIQSYAVKFVDIWPHTHKKMAIRFECHVLPGEQQVNGIFVSRITSKHFAVHDCEIFSSPLFGSSKAPKNGKEGG